MIAFKTPLVKIQSLRLKAPMQLFLKALAAYQGELFVITSTVRTPDENNAAGGLPTSKHLTGDAVDIRTRNLLATGKAFIVQTCQDQNLTFLDEGDHLHIQTK
jgi:hypothetical protein